MTRSILAPPASLARALVASAGLSLPLLTGCSLGQGTGDDVDIAAGGYRDDDAHRSAGIVGLRQGGGASGHQGQGQLDEGRDSHGLSPFVGRNGG